MPKHALRTAVELASVLAGSWRPESPKVSNDVLERLAPLISQGGAAALTWFRIRQKRSELSEPVASFYHTAYVGSAAHAAVHEVELESVAQAFNACRVRCILLKGWSVGRLYPESGLRPCGDIDLWVDPEQRDRADAILRELAIIGADLEHDQLRRFEERHFEEFYASCETVLLGATSIRVPRCEDQVRILCLHFLKHGGWRPIWLCDIAVLLESRNGDLNWEVCLGKNVKRARWIGCTIALARELLGARVPDGVPSTSLASAPRWLSGTVLREWVHPRHPHVAGLSRSLPGFWRRPWEVKNVIAGRWRNSVQATVDCNGAFNCLPRLPYQVRDAVARTVHFFANPAN